MFSHILIAAITKLELRELNAKLSRLAGTIKYYTPTSGECLVPEQAMEQRVTRKKIDRLEAVHAESIEALHVGDVATHSMPQLSHDSADFIQQTELYLNALIEHRGIGRTRVPSVEERVQDLQARLQILEAKLAEYSELPDETITELVRRCEPYITAATQGIRDASFEASFATERAKIVARSVDVPDASKIVIEAKQTISDTDDLLATARTESDAQKREREQLEDSLLKLRARLESQQEDFSRLKAVSDQRAADQKALADSATMYEHVMKSIRPPFQKRLASSVHMITEQMINYPDTFFASPVVTRVVAAINELMDRAADQVRFALPE